jgi:diguanylate cyclase (GGDEF)-like protein
MKVLPLRPTPGPVANDSAPSEARSSLAASIERIADAMRADPQDAAASRSPAVRAALDGALNAARSADRLFDDMVRRLEQLESLAVTDPLTGLFNRRGFEREMERALATARRHRDVGVLVYIDLDGFKPINDTLGHAAGDEVLKRVAQILVENVRESDRVARVGGDEFVVLLTRTERDGGLARAETLNDLVNCALVAWQGRLIPIRASFGFQAYGGEDAADTLLARADEAMYTVKKVRGEARGRDRRRV